jgi:hypothetical protein
MVLEGKQLNCLQRANFVEKHIHATDDAQSGPRYVMAPVLHEAPQSCQDFFVGKT